MIQVALADDHLIVLNGLQKILATEPDICVDDMYINGEELLAGLVNRQPDILLLDIQMPGKNGIELAGIISKKYPQVKIIALTNVDITIQVKKMMQQGCMGYLLKNSSPDVLINAIRTVYNGEQYLHESLSKQLMNDLFSGSHKQLTKREKEILRLITEEHTNQEIADMLYLSLRTVENHRNNLLQKLDVKNTAGLVKIAIRDGLV